MLQRSGKTTWKRCGQNSEKSLSGWVLHKDKLNRGSNLPEKIFSTLKRNSCMRNIGQDSGPITTQGGVVVETVPKAPRQSQGIIEASDYRTASRVVSMETIKHTFSQAQQLLGINDSLYRFKNIVNGASIASFVRQCLIKRAVRDLVLSCMLNSKQCLQ